jgi:hypothetical protein
MMKQKIEIIYPRAVLLNSTEKPLVGLEGVVPAARRNRRTGGGGTCGEEKSQLNVANNGTHTFVSKLLAS